jgi:hypothetical protein
MRPKLYTLLLVCGAFLLGAYLAPTRVTSPVVSAAAAAAADETRAADRQAIRAHIDKIFKAYGDLDCPTIRATHAQNWIGFTSAARSIMHGIDDYMRISAPFCSQTPPPKRDGPGFNYKLTEIDYVFYGDVALVPYVAETWAGDNAANANKLRSIDIYAKVNGEWNQVGSNIYPHPDTVRQQTQRLRQLAPPEQQALLAAREAVWRAFFAGDQAQLDKLLPAEALVIGDAQMPIADRAHIFEAAKRTAGGGAKLVRLEFPRTEMQVYGETAILYTTYLFELENAQGQHHTETGRGTEIFVRRGGAWLNTGWHLQPDKTEK